MLLFSLFLALVAGLTLASPFTTLRTRDLAASDFVISLNTLSLTRQFLNPVNLDAGGTAGTARITSHAADYYNPNQTSFTVAGVNNSQSLIADVTIGEQTFGLLVDITSADTWVIGSDFQCFTPYLEKVVNQSECNTADVYYHTSSTFFQFPQSNHFNITYEHGEFVLALAATERVTLGTITVNNQTLGIAEAGAWNGNSYASGALGLAYGNDSRMYTGLDYMHDNFNNHMMYDTLLTTISKQSSIAPIFALAVNRNTPNDANAGWMALGGIPNVSFHEPMVSAEIVPATGEQELRLYNIIVGGMTYFADDGTPFDETVPASWLAPPVAGANGNTTYFQANLDTGTNAFYIPQTQAIAINALFQPPAQYDPVNNLFWVNCSAVPPHVGFQINHVFYMNQADLIEDNQDGTCMSTIRIAAPYRNILGIQFFWNTLVDFDVGPGMMRIAARQYY